MRLPFIYQAFRPALALALETEDLFKLKRIFCRSNPNGKKRVPMKVLYNLRTEFPEFTLPFDRNFGFFAQMVNAPGEEFQKTVMNMTSKPNKKIIVRCVMSNALAMQRCFWLDADE